MTAVATGDLTPIFNIIPDTVLKAALQNHRTGQSAIPAVDRLADAA